MAGYARGHVGLVAGVLHGEHRVTRVYGRSGERGRRLDDRTLFRIGPLSRVLVGLLLADATVRGELELDRTLGALVEGVHPRLAHVTLRELATQRAGLPPRRPRWLRGRDPLTVLTRRPRHAPGRRVRPTELGTEVLALLLARDTGATFDEQLAERVTGPLGLGDTTAALRADQSTRLARGHRRSGRPLTDARSGPPVTGGLHSTVNDLLTLEQAHLDGRLGGATELAMRSQARAGRRARVALGWQLLEHRSRPDWWWQNGAVPGYAGFLGLVPSSGTGVVVLANSTRPVELLGMTLLARLSS